jgi:anti-anti-sigma factor
MGYLEEVEGMDMHGMVRDTTNIISITGSLDAVNAPEAIRFMLAQVESGWNQLVLDLSQVDFMSSAGLRTILMVLKECRHQGGDLRLVGPNAAIGKILKITGFIGVMQVFDDIDQAVNSFAMV